MNEDLQEVLADLIGSAIEAKDFLLAEVPEVIHQLLLWHGVKSGLSFLAAMTTLVLYARAVKCFFGSAANKKSILYKANDGWDMGDAAGLSAILGLVSIIPIVAFWSIDWLQILVAPKVYLIEYAAKLVN